MAKIDGVIQFTGKLGEVVGQKGQSGRNYLRVRRREIKNPRSDKQSIQRMILATVGASIAYLAEVLRTSVEGKQAGAQTLAYLRSLWMRQLRTDDILEGNGFNYLSKGENRFAANPYVLSKGQLGSYSVTEIATNASTFKIAGMPANFNGAMTASQLFPNVALGDQITIIAVGDVTDGSSDIAYCRFAFKNDNVPALVDSSDDGRYILNPAAIDLTKVAGAYDQLVFLGADGVIATTDDDRVFLAADLCAAGIIVSNLENNRRSNSSLYVLPSYRGTWNAATVAYPTYGEEGVGIDMASDVYLNNSTTPTVGVPPVVLVGSSIPDRGFYLNREIEAGAGATVDIVIASPLTEQQAALFSTSGVSGGDFDGGITGMVGLKVLPYKMPETNGTLTILYDGQPFLTVNLVSE